MSVKSHDDAAWPAWLLDVGMSFVGKELAKDSEDLLDTDHMQDAIKQLCASNAYVSVEAAVRAISREAMSVLFKTGVFEDVRLSNIYARRIEDDKTVSLTMEYPDQL